MVGLDARADGPGLEEWMTTNGPLWPPAAFALALGVTACVSRLPDAELGKVIASLNIANIVRGEHGGWSWVPVGLESSRRRALEREVIERLGAILFHCLTAQTLPYPFPGEQALRARVRSLRPDLPATAVDIILDALTARRGTALTLSDFAEDLRQALGIQRSASMRPSVRALSALAVTAAIVVPLLAWLWTASRTRERIESNDLTVHETAMVDIATEAASSFAMIDEHTASLQVYQQIARLWQTRVHPDDPRLAWIEAHEGWVRTLAGDRLTTEQVFENKPPWLGSQLGERHPYTRMARLALATTLEARGMTARAAVLRAEAERDTRDLFRATALTLAFDPDPVPPGVLAHAAPNSATREGFRRTREGGYFAPLTSTQMHLAGQQGWRLHVIATATCRASVTTVASGLALSAERSANGHWKVSIEGVNPAATLDADPADSLGISIVKNSTGPMAAQIGARRIALSLDDTPARRPSPPYALAFEDGASGSGCALVWLEIPFPEKAAFRRH